MRLASLPHFEGVEKAPGARGVLARAEDVEQVGAVARDDDTDHALPRLAARRCDRDAVLRGARAHRLAPGRLVAREGADALYARARRPERELVSRAFARPPHHDDLERDVLAHGREGSRGVAGYG